MKNILIFLILFFPFLTNAQTGDYLGHFSDAEKAVTDCPFESGSPAMVLLDKGRVSNTLANGGFALESILNHHVRIKILTKEGLEYANIELPYQGDDNAFLTLDAAVFTPDEKGEWIRYNPNSDDIHDEVVDAQRGLMLKKIALPHVKVGSIIEYNYSMKVRRLNDWYFQWEIPVVKSEFTTLIAKNFQYYPEIMGSHPVKEEKEEIEQTTQKMGVGVAKTTVSSNGRVTTRTVQPADSQPPQTSSIFNHKWTAINVPSYRKEPFQAARKQNISHIRFLLKAVSIGGNSETDDAGTYPEFNEKLLKDADFGKHLKAKSTLLPKMGVEVSGTNAKEDARIIFNKISTLPWEGDFAFIPNRSPQKTIKKGGNSAALNMLLIVALREAGIQAFPVISYEWNNGHPDKTVPNPRAYDFLLCAVDFKGDGSAYTFLDATAGQLPFGQLPLPAVNGDGLLVDKERQGWVSLQEGAVYEQASGVKLHFEDGKIKGEIKSRLKGYAKLDFLLNKDGEAREKAEKRFKTHLADGWEVGRMEIEAAGKDKPVTISIPLEREVDMEDIIYLEPILLNLFEENPFKTEDRVSSVDFRHGYRYKYAVTIDLPEGYVVEELPEKAAFQMPDGWGKFTLSPLQIAGKVQFNVMLTLDKTHYNPAEEYNILREFLMLSFEKMEGMVVLKKVE